ncbi:hypothetical protein BLNAU_19654 [Blattamonas nauphoetae]|uniref:Uncharacterized protein n=1 Tax=Blattamonas nauphoetae TaxID=2049346 RepID=A0ABQ9X0X1_9EUKA|nr:hypothetical protein BLNAU_19654 [Blattamonas nauphoetae]
MTTPLPAHNKANYSYPYQSDQLLTDYLPTDLEPIQDELASFAPNEELDSLLGTAYIFKEFPECNDFLANDLDKLTLVKVLDRCIGKLDSTQFSDRSIAVLQLLVGSPSFLPVIVPDDLIPSSTKRFFKPQFARNPRNQPPQQPEDATPDNLAPSYAYITPDAPPNLYGESETLDEAIMDKARGEYGYHSRHKKDKTVIPPLFPEEGEDIHVNISAFLIAMFTHFSSYGQEIIVQTTEPRFQSKPADDSMGLGLFRPPFHRILALLEKCLLFSVTPQRDFYLEMSNMNFSLFTCLPPPNSEVHSIPFKHDNNQFNRSCSCNFIANYDFEQLGTIEGQHGQQRFKSTALPFIPPEHKQKPQEKAQRELQRRLLPKASNNNPKFALYFYLNSHNFELEHIPTLPASSKFLKNFPIPAGVCPVMEFTVMEDNVVNERKKKKNSKGKEIETHIGDVDIATNPQGEVFPLNINTTAQPPRNYSSVLRVFCPYRSSTGSLDAPNRIQENPRSNPKNNHISAHDSPSPFAIHFDYLKRRNPVRMEKPAFPKGVRRRRRPNPFANPEDCNKHPAPTESVSTLKQPNTATEEQPDQPTEVKKDVNNLPTPQLLPPVKIPNALYPFQHKADPSFPPYYINWLCDYLSKSEDRILPIRPFVPHSFREALPIIKDSVTTLQSSRAAFAPLFWFHQQSPNEKQVVGRYKLIEPLFKRYVTKYDLPPYPYFRTLTLDNRDFYDPRYANLGAPLPPAPNGDLSFVMSMDHQRNEHWDKKLDPEELKEIDPNEKDFDDQNEDDSDIDFDDSPQPSSLSKLPSTRDSHRARGEASDANVGNWHLKQTKRYREALLPPITIPPMEGSATPGTIDRRAAMYFSPLINSRSSHSYFTSPARVNEFAKEWDSYHHTSSLRPPPLTVPPRTLFPKDHLTPFDALYNTISPFLSLFSYSIVRVVLLTHSAFLSIQDPNDVKKTFQHHKGFKTLMGLELEAPEDAQKLPEHRQQGASSKPAYRLHHLQNETETVKVVDMSKSLSEVPPFLKIVSIPVTLMKEKINMCFVEAANTPYDAAHHCLSFPAHLRRLDHIEPINFPTLNYSTQIPCPSFSVITHNNSRFMFSTVVRIVTILLHAAHKSNTFQYEQLLHLIQERKFTQFISPFLDENTPPQLFFPTIVSSRKKEDPIENFTTSDLIDALETDAQNIRSEIKANKENMLDDVLVGIDDENRSPLLKYYWKSPFSVFMSKDKFQKIASHKFLSKVIARGRGTRAQHKTQTQTGDVTVGDYARKVERTLAEYRRRNQRNWCRGVHFSEDWIKQREDLMRAQNMDPLFPFDPKDKNQRLAFPSLHMIGHSPSFSTSSAYRNTFLSHHRNKLSNEKHSLDPDFYFLRSYTSQAAPPQITTVPRHIQYTTSHVMLGGRFVPVDWQTVNTFVNTIGLVHKLINLIPSRMQNLPRTSTLNKSMMNKVNIPTLKNVNLKLFRDLYRSSHHSKGDSQRPTVQMAMSTYLNVPYRLGDVLLVSQSQLQSIQSKSQRRTEGEPVKDPLVLALQKFHKANYVTAHFFPSGKRM